MYLVVNQMMELKIIHITYRNTVIELFSGSSVVQNSLAVLVHSGSSEARSYIVLVSAVEYRRHNMPAKSLCGHSEMNLKHLTYIHTRRHAQWIQYYIKRRSIGEERHILLWKYP